jgi:glyoxylase-like metal-dependent hydrolase (beta-lactamase superfamily II)/ferredoxin
MADQKKRLATNVVGEFFVDSTCINCDTCRQLAPETFVEEGEYSAVFHQPVNEEQRRTATRALLACPTGSIGTTGSNKAKEVMADFPLRLEDHVYYNGFNSPKSYGANSYFVQHADGNWLIDSPKYLPHLIKKFEEAGGIKYIFLTHRDDVADADKYAEHFGSTRIIHRADLVAEPDAEMVIDGEDDAQVGEQFVIIPTPGHTQGHCVLLYDNKYLFTGDHLDWNHKLEVFQDYCWYSFAEQIKSVEKLKHYRFEWILPGHGGRVKLSPAVIQQELDKLVASCAT